MASESPRITPAKMGFLGVGWLGAQFFWGFHSGSMPLFLRSFTESKFTISLVLSLAGVTGCLVPPVVGYLSDRSFTRFGRRKPYIFAGFLGVFVCLLGLPHVSAIGAAALISGLMYFSLRTAETPYLSLLPDITPPQQRSTASGVMNMFGSIGLIACFGISSAIWGRRPVTVFNLVALVSFLSMMLALVLIREPDHPEENASGPTLPLNYIKGLISETNVLKFFLAQFFLWLGFWMISSFLTLFAVEELNAPEGKSLLVPMVFAVVATVFMVPLGILGDRFGRKGILSVMLGFWAVLCVIMGLSQTFEQALVTVAITGIPFAALMGVGYAYLLDLIPKDRTAEFVGFSIISVAVAQIVGPLGGGKLIDALGYRSLFPSAAVMMIVGLAILQFT
ncbi:MFS transporter, partial [Candidatus Poribacteria bacterium]|nr:MFS transporter [Candidatus Poribacteria bacterium]